MLKDWESIMTKELVITTYENRICACLYEDSQLMELQVLSKNSSTNSQNQLVNDSDILGNIYVAKVQNVVKNLDAAFVEIQPGLVCYYSLKENHHHFLNPKNTDKVVIGDELLVQVTKEAIKTKAPLAGSELQLTGNLVIVTYGNGNVGISNKLPKDEKTQEMKTFVEAKLPEGYGAIIRTNAYESSIEALEQEFDRLLQKLFHIVEQAKFHKVYSCLYQERTLLAKLLDDCNNKDLVRIITDIPEIQKELAELLPEEEKHKIEYFQPGLQPLYAIYRLDRDWKELTGKHVWLKSGAYLVIEQTEAMVVIDVNTGKSVNKKNREEHFLKVNQEAATEIARQLRLRNLSGIILIDFIDMENLEYKEQLVEHLCREIQKDRIQTSYIDITRLNLVELTRKKVRKSLGEML